MCWTRSSRCAHQARRFAARFLRSQRLPRATNHRASATESATEAAAGGNWSKLIDAETIETEIKRLSQQVGKDVTTPAPFKGGGYKDCRRDFSVLAALFAVSAEYDGDVRWKDVGRHFRDVFARAGHNCKVGTDQTYQEAAQRKQDLADLSRGSRPKTAAAERKADWGHSRRSSAADAANEYRPTGPTAKMARAVKTNSPPIATM